MTENTDEIPNSADPLQPGTQPISDEQAPYDNSAATSKRKPMEIIEELLDTVKTHGIAVLVVVALFVLPILLGIAWYHMVAFVVIYVVVFMAIRSHGGNGWDD